MKKNGIGPFLTLIRSKSKDHKERFQAAVSAIIKETEKIYLDEVDLFVSSYQKNPGLEKVLRPFYTKISEYLKWLRWVYWNIANLGPVLFKESEAAARRLALASIAYASGRFIDDGFDNHESFKGRQRTLVGFLRDNSPGRPVYEDCVQSVYAGFHLFNHIVTRFRDLDNDEIANELSKLFNIASIGLLAECHTGEKITPDIYFQIIRRKAVAYNMILYKPFLLEVELGLRNQLLAILAEMDELAQILNDLGDKEEDMLKKKMNISSHLENSSIIINDEIELRVQKLMNMLSPLPVDIQNAFAAMLVNLKLETNFKSPEPAEPVGPDSEKDSIQWVSRIAGTTVVQNAIDNALRYLESSQQVNGEFATYWSENMDMTQPHKISSPFITGMILLALQDVKSNKISILRKKGIAFLEKCRKSNGFFSFLETGIDDDLDDTCLLNFIIQTKYGKQDYYAALATQISQLPQSNGLYYTWIRDFKETLNDIDVCVNLNIVRFLSFNGIDCSATIKVLRSVFENNTVFEGTLYYQPVWAFLYFFSGLSPELKREVVTDSRLTSILTYSKTTDSVNLAMRLFCLASAGAKKTEMLPLVFQLLKQQGETGAWPNCPVFRAFNYWGSPDLTTAVCIQALQKYNENRENRDFHKL